MVDLTWLTISYERTQFCLKWAMGPKTIEHRLEYSEQILSLDNLSTK